MKLKKLLPKAFSQSPGVQINRDNTPFRRGNQLATNENLTTESQDKRRAALFRGWETKARKSRGEKVVTAYEQKGKRPVRERIKLRETLMLEAREIQDMARMGAGEAMQVLKEIISDQSTRSSDKISAIGLLLDRAYGKSTQTNVNATVDATGKESDVSTAELDRRIKTALERVETIAGGTGQEAEGKERPANVRERDRNTGGSSIH